MNNEAEREMTIREVIVCLFVDVIIVFMLLWIIFTALGLTLEPIGDGQYSIHHYLIKSVVGNVTALIGFCYFAFGVGIAVELSSMLQPREKKGSSIHEEHNTNLECLVWCFSGKSLTLQICTAYCINELFPSYSNTKLWLHSSGHAQGQSMVWETILH